MFDLFITIWTYHEKLYSSWNIHIHHPEMRTKYLLKPGQTLENTKASERSRALVVTKDTFQRFVDYTTEEDRIMAQREEEAAKIAALRKATYEKSKTWDTIENIKVRRREELLSKRQKAEEERRMFVKEMTEKKVAERAEVVQQARRLLQQKRPLYRQINRALLVSECLRELDAQVAFQKAIKAMDKEHDVKYANSIKTDAAKYEGLKKQEEEEKRAKKMRDYKIALEKQIEENERNTKLKAAEELEAEKQDQRNTTQDMQHIKEKEMQEMLNKKKRLQQFFKEAIEEKKRFQLELKYNEELEDQAIEVYREAKDRVQKIHKSLTLKEKEEKARQKQIIAEQHDSNITLQIRKAKERDILKKAIEEKEAVEAEKRKAQKEREEKMRALMEEYRLHDAAVKMKQRQDEKDLKAWEMMQRFKRDEYDKQTNLEERKKQWQQKLEYGNELRKDIEEKRTDEREKEVLEVEATKAAIEKANQKILLYGDEVLEESKGVRPLYPIVKAIEEIKKEMGLTSNKKKLEESTVKAERPKRKYRGRRCMCPKPVPVDQIYYLQ